MAAVSGPDGPGALGLDGARGGWVGALVHEEAVFWFWFERIADALARRPGVLGVDIPIGLPERAPRVCDIRARARLAWPRTASVFPAPPRVVLGAQDHAHACALARERTGAGIPIQAWHLVPKIREADDVLEGDPDAPLVEVHPEVSFAALAGRRSPSLPTKHTAAGRAARLALLRRWVAPRLTLSEVPRPARAHDALDAVAVAWSAGRFAAGVAELLTDPSSPRDARGRPMRIVV